MASAHVIEGSRSSIMSYASSASSVEDEGGSSGFSWSSSEAGTSFSSSPATSAFSSSPSSSRSTLIKPHARRRASTSASNTLEYITKLNTLPENDDEGIVVDPNEILVSSPISSSDFHGLENLRAQGLGISHVQLPPPQQQDSETFDVRSELEPMPLASPISPPTPVEVYLEIDAQQNGQTDDLVEQPVNMGITSEERDNASDSRRPPLPTKLSMKLFRKGRDRAGSFTKLNLIRPALEQSRATGDSGVLPSTTGEANGSTTPESSDNEFRETPRRRAFERLQSRFAKSAPSSPPLTPSSSIERIHLFRSRPSSIVLTGRGVEFNYFSSSSLGQTSLSQPSSCNASDYQPALDHLGNSSSVDDLLGQAGQEVFEDALPQNSFDGHLPRELRLKIFSMIVESSVDEYEMAQRERSWTAQRAGRERWIGETGGLRELVKMSRVCREWRDLVFDGQLWQNVYISRSMGCDTFTAAGLIKLAHCAGSFLRRLDLRGFSQLGDDDLDSITHSCTNYAGVTSLEYIDLSGCSSITTQSLHTLLSCSPRLANLNLRGLLSVISATCYVVLAVTVHRLKTLDVSLCRNLRASALLSISQPQLEELHAAKIPSMDTRVVAALPEYFPNLQYLDVGYSRQVNDEAFKQWPQAEGTNANLRGLRLSGCPRLTDQTCLNLVGKVSALECFEMASVGTNLRDTGLVKLIEACPNLRKLDLEDATNLTDRVLAALTPSRQHRGPPSVLEHLNVTNVPELSEAALVRLIKASPALRVIECSNCFNVSELFIKAFTHHVKKYSIKGAELAMVDCRSVGRQSIRDHANTIRTRRGIREYSSRHFGYLEPDGRTKSLSECDENKIVVHSFWTWQQVDEMEGAARSLRTAQLAREVGAGSSSSYSYPFTLRAARRASFGNRGGSDGVERTGGGCIIS